MPKEKLTLSVDKEVVQKAKNLGINISEITEKVLAGYTAAEKPEGDLYDAYQQLFDSILPLLKEFDCSVKIGDGVEHVTFTDSGGKETHDEVPITIFLCSDNSFYVDPFGDSFSDIRGIAQGDFFSPEKILSNLISSLAGSKEKRKEKMAEIQMAKRIIEAMSESLLKKPSTKQTDK
jgi:hypothetical protein